MKQEENILWQDIRLPHNINISNFLFKKLKNHIQILKNYESRGITNQTWISNAIKIKIEKTEKILENEIPRNKVLCINFDPVDLVKITEQVDIIHKQTGSYSRTKWIIEAIMDQLEEEQEKIDAYPKMEIAPPKRKLRGLTPLKVTNPSPLDEAL